MTDGQIARRTLPISLAARSGDAVSPIRRHGNTKYDDLDIIEALQEVYARVGITHPHGLTHKKYGKLKRLGQPSEALIVSRLGTWAGACELAGIPSGVRRSRDTYHSKWTDDEMFAIVRRYRHHTEANQMTATFWGYEMYQRGQTDAPSGTMLRQRMGRLGLTSWAATLTASQDLGLAA